MATTDAVKVMARKRKETHERLARGLNHEPTLRLLGNAPNAAPIVAMLEADCGIKKRRKPASPDGFEEWALQQAFADVVASKGLAHAMRLIGREIERVPA
jgi:hypothetical protein